MMLLGTLLASLLLIIPAANGRPSNADDAPAVSGSAYHWSYQPIRRPEVPNHWRPQTHGVPVRCLSPVDSFIFAEQERHNLLPAGPADPATLMRRLYLDLIGLPPTRAELLEFLTDPSDDAYEHLVERLLADPRHGERWGRHWMDVWRYSDWYGSRGGNEIRYSQRGIWLWRDWIVQSVDADKGYDRMVQEMIAGDELAPADPDVTRATGFIGRNWYKFDRNVWMFDVVEHTAQAFLAMTLRCARCHDHKYDPISHQDYFRVRAFFEPHDVRTDPLSGNGATEKDATLGQVLSNGLARVYDKQLDTPTFVFARGDSRYPDESQRMEPAVPPALGLPIGDIQAVALPMDSYAPWLRAAVLRDKTAAAAATIQQAAAKVEQTTSALVSAERSLADLIDRQAGGIGDSATEQSDNKPAETATMRAMRQAELSLKLAQRGCKTALQEQLVAQADLESLECRVAADRAKVAGTNDFDALATRAATAEHRVKVMRAEHDVLAADHALFIIRTAENEAGSDALAEKPNRGPSTAMDEEARRKARANAESKLVAAHKTLDNVRSEAAKQDSTYSSIGPVYPKTSSGRRLALANWIVNPANPRTARVAVNHIWLRHFGQPLVPTVANFGINGSPPSHPELLDWLAAEFMEHGWSMKHIHRLIVLSYTYRQSSSDRSSFPSDAVSAQAAAGPEYVSRALAIDSENRLLWRMNSRRLESETIRDSVLFVSGRLDATRGGPEIPEALGQESLRRSIYFRSTPNEKMSMLESFDQANPNECYRRQESIVPQQALTLSNSSLCMNQSRVLARQLSEELGMDDRPETTTRFIEAAFETILSRPPTLEESLACTRFLVRHATLLRSANTTSFPPASGSTTIDGSQEVHLRARENLVHVLFNHNDFVTIR
jgi:hypothetical protein